MSFLAFCVGFGEEPHFTINILSIYNSLLYSPDSLDYLRYYLKYTLSCADCIEKAFTSAKRVFFYEVKRIFACNRIIKAQFLFSYFVMLFTLTTVYYYFVPFCVFTVLDIRLHSNCNWFVCIFICHQHSC